MRAGPLLLLGEWCKYQLYCKLCISSSRSDFIFRKVVNAYTAREQSTFNYNALNGWYTMYTTRHVNSRTKVFPLLNNHHAIWSMEMVFSKVIQWGIAKLLETNQPKLGASYAIIFRVEIFPSNFEWEKSILLSLQYRSSNFSLNKIMAWQCGEPRDCMGEG